MEEFSYFYTERGTQEIGGRQLKCQHRVYLGINPAEGGPSQYQSPTTAYRLGVDIKG
jgi:hypothetical protein